jgi:hypothetical protein
MSKRNQERIEAKFSRLFNSIAELPSRIAEAFQEGMSEDIQLSCVRDGLLDFNLVEEDIAQIQKLLKARGDSIIGSHLILDDRKELLEIRTYVEREGKTFSVYVDAEVRRVTNIPEDVLEELEKEEKVELHFKASK